METKQTIIAVLFPDQNHLSSYPAQRSSLRRKCTAGQETFKSVSASLPLSRESNTKERRIKWKLRTIKFPIREANLNRNTVVPILCHPSYLYLIRTEDIVLPVMRTHHPPLNLEELAGNSQAVATQALLFLSLPLAERHQSRPTTGINRRILQLPGQPHPNQFISVCPNSSSVKHRQKKLNFPILTCAFSDSFYFQIPKTKL